jgi:hypothetical protein
MAGLLKERAPATDEGFDPDKFLGPDEFDPDKFLAAPSEPQGELSGTDRVGLGFMSGEDERRRYIQQKHPGAKFGKWKDQDVVFLPGEKSPRYVDDPKLTWNDAADFVGDIPGMVGGLVGSAAGSVAGPAGTVVGAGVGAATGEAGRKAIGRKYFLGEDAYQPDKLKGDLIDVGISGAAGSGGQVVSNAAVGYLGRRAAQKGLEAIGKEHGPEGRRGRARCRRQRGWRDRWARGAGRSPERWPQGPSLWRHQWRARAGRKPGR